MSGSSSPNRAGFGQNIQHLLTNDGSFSQPAPAQAPANPRSPSPARDGNQPYGNATTQAQRAALLNPAIAAIMTGGRRGAFAILSTSRPSTSPLLADPAAPPSENPAQLTVQQEAAYLPTHENAAPAAIHAAPYFRPIAPAPTLPHVATNVSPHNADVPLSNQDIINNAVHVLNRPKKSALRHLGQWLEKNGRGNLNDILNSGPILVNQNVLDWLNAPRKENPYGRKGSRGGISAVTALLQAYGKPLKEDPQAFGDISQ